MKKIILIIVLIICIGSGIYLYTKYSNDEAAKKKQLFKIAYAEQCIKAAQYNVNKGSISEAKANEYCQCVTKIVGENFSSLKEIEANKEKFNALVIKCEASLIADSNFK
jgi:hypothetical protein